MNQSKESAILALLAGAEAPAPVISTGIRFSDTYDFIQDPFASREDFTFLGHIPVKSSRDIRPAIVVKNFPLKRIMVDVLNNAYTYKAPNRKLGWVLGF